MSIRLTELVIVTAAINNFVKEWPQYLSLISAKNINLETIKLCKEKHNVPLWTQPVSFTLLGNGAQICICSSTSHLIAGSFSPSSVHHSGSCSTKMATKLWAKKINVELAFCWIRSSRANSLSLSHSSNIIIHWWTTPVFQHCQRILKQENSRSFKY